MSNTWWNSRSAPKTSQTQTKYHDARMKRDKEIYERQIKLVDAQIDRLVYDLYGLTKEEIKIVEDVFE